MPEEEDFFAKLLIIEHEANLVAEDLTLGSPRTRIEQIATIARLLRFRLNVVPGAILPGKPWNEEQKDLAAKLELMRKEASEMMRGLPPGVVRERLNHITALADLVLARLGAPKPPAL